MNTRDPDRCVSAITLEFDGLPLVVQCQSTVHHEGKHDYHQDHYIVRWSDPQDSQPTRRSDERSEADE
jgi:hypothetical protein